MSPRPDTCSVIAGLKDFQRATVDYVFARFFGPDSTRRFLVADEVGLGKTLVARGVIARTIDLLWKEMAPIDVIYICSNADIARQNIQRLRIPGCRDAAQATRLTLLPLELPSEKDGLSHHRVNFVALTPATSFEQTGGGGRIDERVLLYWLLDRAWGIHGARASLYVMQDYASVQSFERDVISFSLKIAAKEIAINEGIATEFVSSLARRVQEERKAGKSDLRSRFEELRRTFCRSNSRLPEGATKRRTQWIGELRRLLARVCLSALEPDLIIMDEFQRFKHLLEENSEAGELARDLFGSEAGLGARVLLLSATPYRGLSLHHETDDDHYGDFLALLRFLENGDAEGCKEILAEYRAALPAVMTPEGLARLRKAKAALELRLRRVMARTERLASDVDRGGMLLDAPPASASLQAIDVQAYLGVQSIADAVEQGDVVEYWKSAPYLFNFMDDYALKRAFVSTSQKHELLKLVRAFPQSFLDLDRARAYQKLEPANPRLRGLLAETVDRGMWRLLWIPPTLNYYEADGPFMVPELARSTKRLVFSAWHMVPRAVASLISYEAERCMMRAPHPRKPLTQEDWTKQRGLLRFRISAERLTGLPLLLLVYPCLVFARDCDPRELAREKLLTAAEAKSQFANRIRDRVERLGIAHELTGNVDERWYWLTPMLLDFAEFREAARAWWGRAELSQIWAGFESGEDEAGWARHVQKAAETLDSIRRGNERLGLPPDDLFDVLGLAASAAPATATLRALARVTQGDPTDSLVVLDTAARTGRAFLSLFNHAEVTEVVRTEFRGEPYWQRVLEYAHAGGLQAVLDEYAHLLKESLGVAAAPAAEMAEKISAELIGALTLRTASLRIDEVTAPPYAREVKLNSEPMHIRFAMRFGDDRYGEKAQPAFAGLSTGTRKERVRAAFNSPFWPFVLVSTSVGQEGLDFHHYCHAVTHWNLPSNPVDLEQREGRIHRYKGHAVRKNVAAAYASDALRQPERDVWEAMFGIGRARRPAQENDLVPYWLFPGEAKIERHVPAMPFSREVERLHELRRSLAIYRMVFGQNRQEDLIIYLLDKIPENERSKIVAELQIDLSPASHEQPRLEDRPEQPADAGSYLVATQL
jgi:hypothetical protein